MQAPTESERNKMKLPKRNSPKLVKKNKLKLSRKNKLKLDALKYKILDTIKYKKCKIFHTNYHTVGIDDGYDFDARKLVNYTCIYCMKCMHSFEYNKVSVNELCEIKDKSYKVLYLSPMWYQERE